MMMTMMIHFLRFHTDVELEAVVEEKSAMEI
jgi:hypothetical protein